MSQDFNKGKIAFGVCPKPPALIPFVRFITKPGSLFEQDVKLKEKYTGLYLCTRMYS